MSDGRQFVSSPIPCHSAMPHREAILVSRSGRRWSRLWKPALSPPPQRRIQPEAKKTAANPLAEPMSSQKFDTESKTRLNTKLVSFRFISKSGILQRPDHGWELGSYAIYNLNCDHQQDSATHQTPCRRKKRGSTSIEVSHHGKRNRRNRK